MDDKVDFIDEMIESNCKEREEEEQQLVEVLREAQPSLVEDTDEVILRMVRSLRYWAPSVLQDVPLAAVWISNWAAHGGISINSIEKLLQIEKLKTQIDRDSSPLSKGVLGL